MKRIFPLILLTVSVGILVVNVQALPEDYIVVGILGQSNAAGYSICPEELPSVPDGIYNFGNDYQLRPAQEPIDIGTNQVDMVSYDLISRCGPAVALGMRLHKYLQKNIILVPCARGGSFALQWLPAYTSDTLYGSCLHRLQTANTGNYPTMIFFFQGESDARQLESALSWDNKFIAIATALKTDLNDPYVVFVQLSEDPNLEVYPYFNELKAEQAQINLPHVVMVKSDDLPLDSTGHLSYESAFIVGIRAGDALCKMANPQCVDK